MKKAPLAITVLTALVVSACSSGSTPPPGPNQPSDTNDGCTKVVVATSSEKVNMMEELGKTFKESPEMKALDKCATIYPINVASGRGATILAENPSSWPLADKNFWPTVWSPASTIWTDRVAAAGAGNLVADAKSFTHTPVVLGMPESMAKALGYPGKDVSLADVEKLIQAPDGWGSVGKPLWGSFKVAKTNPNTSTTGLEIILMQSYAAAKKAKDLTPADVEAAAPFSKAFEEGAIHYGDTTGNVLTTLYNASRNGKQNSNYVSAVALEETSLFNYNKGNPDSHTVQPGEQLTPPGEKLVAVYPKEGSMWSDNPAVALNTQWVTLEQKAASQAFVKFLNTKPAQEVLPKYGFRPLDTSVDVSQSLNASVGIDPKKPTVTLPKPDASTVSSAIDLWTKIRKPSAVMELIDLSGSMDEAAGNGKSKLDGAIQGAQSTLGNFRSTDEIGVWAFTTGVKSDKGNNVVPLREFAPLGGDKENVSNSLNDLRQAKKGGTPLYDSIATTYDYMVKKAEPGRINAIVVLTDGADTDSSISLESLLVKINSSAKEGSTDAPVRIFTIAYGKDANKDILKRISAASGGQMFDASDPTKIQDVFTSVINNF